MWRSDEKLAEIIENKRSVINGKYPLHSADDQLVYVDISIAIGGAVRGLGTQNCAELMQKADQNMYLDKENQAPFGPATAASDNTCASSTK
ncbi:hypothetical protein RS130_23085 [Paraglaciecola aquimarina]|uniref:GGDEF domain-containing protein n=1 Tax=Paraglaciecola aquimarina TaxID=1235557 RepID=A0ABU3T298_9ALTE|nr:hypothetical protein [Paraglaciecola aquimarina]MDU0356392.1 hypothetical protein [Paraglaciecola aquimarina]